MPRKKKVTGNPGTGNEELAAAMRELRRSSAASPHQDRRTRKARTRKASRERDIRDELR